MAERGSESSQFKICAQKEPQFRLFPLTTDIPVSPFIATICLCRTVETGSAEIEFERGRLSSNEGVWAFVDSSQGYAHGRRLIKFERGVCYVVEPGFWNYGRFSMRFDSAADADAAEQRLRPQVPKRH